ncbi:MAG: cytochrome c [Rhodospirillaceae bacterium]|nr:cytochrome c [Rhodospirillaceae bacterium]
MNSFKGLLIAGLFLCSGSVALAQISVSPGEDPTSAGAWSGGTASGQGNFMSICASCHGYEGKGDGMLAEELDVLPRNLSDPKFMTAKSDDHLFKVIKEGGASVGLSESMAPFNEQLNDEEIKNIVTYLRSDICKCASGGK